MRDSGCAMLVVEQQVDRALAIADSAVLLAHGSVAWAGPATGAAAAMEELLSGRSTGRRRTTPPIATTAGPAEPTGP